MLQDLFRRITDLRHGLSDHPNETKLPERHFPTAHEIAVGDGDNIYWRGRNCRLVGYDAPELHTKRDLERERGRQARDRLAFHIVAAKVLEIRPLGTEDRFQRPLIQLYVDGVNIADIAVHEGWGAIYQKGKKPKWADERTPFSTERN